MARNSVATERREQIIDATLRTIIEHGVAGASLDRIAEAAGMSRGHVRHFAGNRDTLLLLTAEAVFAGTDGRPSSILPAATDTVEAALNYLFGPEFTSSDAENGVVLGLVELSRSTPAIAEILALAYRRTQAHLTALIINSSPEITAETAAIAAYGVLSAALGNVFLSDFDADAARTQHIRASVEVTLAALASS